MKVWRTRVNCISWCELPGGSLWTRMLNRRASQLLNSALIFWNNSWNFLQINELFKYSLGVAENGAKADVSGYSGLCECVQEVLEDMVFNMFVSELLTFTD